MEENTSDTEKKTVNLWPIYYASLFDMSGFSIMGPFIVFYILTFTDNLAVVANIISVYAICSIFGGPLIGTLSDSFGRREALLLCILGTVVSIALMGASVNILMLGFARALMGFSSTSIPIVNTYITTLIPAEDMMAEISQWSAAIMGAMNVLPLIATLLLLCIQQCGLEERMEYRLMFAIASAFSLVGLIYAYMNVPPLYAKPKEDESSTVISEVPFPTTACLVLGFIQVTVFLPQMGVLVLVPAWWGDNFDKGPIAFGIFLFVSGWFQAYANLKASWLVEKAGGTHQLFIALLVVCGSLHALSGFFHENTTTSFIAHVVILGMANTLSISNVLVNMWAGLYAPEEHRNKVMSSVSSGMWLAYMIAAYAYTGLYTNFNDWAPFVFGGSYCIFTILPVLYLWAHHDEYIAANNNITRTDSLKSNASSLRASSPHASSIHAATLHSISGSCQATFSESLEWDEAICGKREPELTNSSLDKL